MPLLFSKRIEQKDGKTFRVYTAIRPRLSMTLSWTSLILMAIGIFLPKFSEKENGVFVIFFLAGFLLLAILTIIGLVEGGGFSAHPTIANLRKKEFRRTGRMFFSKEPFEQWIEQ